MTTNGQPIDAYEKRPAPAPAQSATQSGRDERVATQPGGAPDEDRGRVAFEAFYYDFCKGDAGRLADLWKYESEASKRKWSRAGDAVAAPLLERIARLEAQCKSAHDTAAMASRNFGAVEREKEDALARVAALASELEQERTRREAADRERVGFERLYKDSVVELDRQRTRVEELEREAEGRAVPLDAERLASVHFDAYQSVCANAMAPWPEQGEAFRKCVTAGAAAVARAVAASLRSDAALDAMIGVMNRRGVETARAEMDDVVRAALAVALGPGLTPSSEPLGDHPDDLPAMQANRELRALREEFENLQEECDARGHKLAAVGAIEGYPVTPITEDARTIAEFVEDFERRKSVGCYIRRAEGTDYAAKRFDVERVADAVAALCREVQRGRRGT